MKLSLHILVDKYFAVGGMCLSIWKHVGLSVFKECGEYQETPWDIRESNGKMVMMGQRDQRR